MPLKFNEKFLLRDIKTGEIKNKRNRKFTPQKLFTTLLYLTAGTNREGYRIAIDKCFDAFNKFYEMPTKGALTQARDRVSYRFFEDQFYSVRSDFKTVQKMIKGFYVYGVDGDIYSIPRNKRTEDNGFYGCPVQGNKESHFLRMYTVSAVDVFSGIPLEFAYGTRCNEIDMALSFTGKEHRLKKPMSFIKVQVGHHRQR